MPIADGPTTAPSGLPGLSLGLYVVLLSIVSEVAAFSAVGLVASWGEVVPRWVPIVGGRRVAMGPAVGAGVLGAAFLTLLWTWVAVQFALGQQVDGRPQSALAPINFHNWRGELAVAAYAPLLLWGPLLGAVTLAYYKRRRREPGPPRDRSKMRDVEQNGVGRDWRRSGRRRPTGSPNSSSTRSIRAGRAEAERGASYPA